MNTNQTLEFIEIQNQLANLALSQNAKRKILNLHPYLAEAECKRHMEETTQAKQLMLLAGTPPLSAMDELLELLELTEIGAMLNPEQLTAVTVFLASCKRMKGYLQKADNSQIAIASYGSTFYVLEELYDEISNCIRNNRIDDCASPALRDIRRKIELANQAIKTKLESILRTHKEWFEDGYVATRNGRFVLPVKKKFKNQISGSVIDVSGTGNTYFIEPSAVRKLQEELGTLEIEEDNEERKILYTLTALVSEYSSALKLNMECMETLDYLFAKGKLSMEMDARPAAITTDPLIIIHQGRHPLLDKKSAVPLDFNLGGEHTGIVITGPNTGGKTVALKTVGLLSIMAQCGLHVPAGEGSMFSMRNVVLCDIGDGQSISQNLSTFSSHITNVISILSQATHESLVLLDELGSGTDPAEGMGIAVAILEELRCTGCLFVATTHYPEIKTYANVTPGLINARMAFDRESLKPLYRLEIGEAGESCALYIAKRLGFPEHLLNRAKKEAYGIQKNNSTDTSYELESNPPKYFKPSVPSQIIKEQPKAAAAKVISPFQVGDSVMVYPMKEIGIVYQPADNKGQMVVQIKKQKLTVSYKRVKLITSASELYPADYDFSIIFDTVENRKNRNQMEKHHRPDLIITQP